MQLPTYYNAGTASVANGAVLITFTGALLGTAEQPNIMPGDLFKDPAQPLVPPQEIASVDYQAGTASLVVGWPGTTMVSAPYKVMYVGIIERSTAQSRRLLEQLSVVQANGRGLFLIFDDAVTDSDPGDGRIRLNNLVVASATAAFIDNLDANGAAIAAIIDTWGTSGSDLAGQLWLRSIAVPSTFHAFDVTGMVVDGTGYRKLTIEHVGGSGAFAANDELMVMFSAHGEQGASFTYDARVDDLAGRAAYDAELEGFGVLVSDIGDGRAAVYYKESATPGDWSIPNYLTGPQGLKGDKGWAPKLAAESDGVRRVFKLVGYVGGEGTEPTDNVGEYLGATGWVPLIANAVDFRGPTGASGIDGTSQFNRVDVAATANVDTTTGLENGDTLDGVTLGTGMVVLLAAQTAPAQNGVYVVVAAGPAARHPSFNTYDSMPGVYFSVMRGTVNADTLWRCTSDKGGTIDVDPLVFDEFTGGVSDGDKGDVVVSGAGTLWTSRVGREQLARNGSFAINQRVTMPTTDNVYSVDGWRLLLEAANAAVIVQDIADVPVGASYALGLTVGSGNNNKFGVFSPIESKFVVPLRSGKVSLRVPLKATAGLTDGTGKIRIGIAEFTGTADSVSGDPISSWGAEGTNPTLAANWAFINTPAAIPVTTSWVDYLVEGISVGAGANNLALIIWSDDKTNTQTTDILRIGGYVTFTEGTAASRPMVLPFDEEEWRCRRYVQPVNNGVGAAASSTTLEMPVQFSPRMRAAPTSVSATGVLSIEDPSTGAKVQSSASVSSQHGTTYGVKLLMQNFTTLTVDIPYLYVAIAANGGHHVLAFADL